MINSENFEFVNIKLLVFFKFLFRYNSFLYTFEYINNDEFISMYMKKVHPFEKRSLVVGIAMKLCKK